MINEDIEKKLPFLVKSVPDNISGIFSTKEKDEKRKLQEKEVFVKKVAQEYDPSNEKNYTGWILKMMVNGSIRGEEDKQKTMETLQDFIQAKLRKKLQGNEADINSYKSLGSLAQIMTEKLGKVVTKREQEKKMSEKGFQLLGKSNNLSLFSISTPEAANKHLQQTGWCVKDPQWWKSYIERHKTESYYMIYDENEDVVEKEESGKKKIYDKRKHRLINFASNEYKNVFDDEVNPTVAEAQFVMQHDDFIQKQESENLGELYLKLLYMSGKKISDEIVEKMIEKKDPLLASLIVKYSDTKKA
ncbi:MAG: hypothetical protein EBR82_12465 [Caulobacteraceae bacterium]|nr:hypothetical protein [Caulobacteraceae bacterium]